MQNTSVKTLQLVVSLALITGLLFTALHAKDIFSRAPKVSKDDNSRTVSQKVAGELHNHIDKFSFKHLKLGSAHNFGADSRSLKKQHLSHKRLQKVTD